jgi:RNA polymerase sigma factor (TIGR02999 family)
MTRPPREDELVSALYDRLHAMAAAVLRSERPDHTLSATALVHEAYLRLPEPGRVEWQDRGHFMAVACRVMRRVLVDHARRRAAAKRGGGERVTLRDDLAALPDRTLEILSLDEALSRLETLDERQARVVEMRFFSGLEVDEIGRVLGVSEATVKRDWRFARAWLLAELAENPA